MWMDDTSLAVSSPQGGAGVRAIVRLSGPDAWTLARRVTDLPAETAPGWRPTRLSVGGLSLPAAALLFRGPRSFTGQDVAELHVANSPALVGMLIETLLRAGGAGAGRVRLAEPGEFTARAFFNGKMDLTEAEGIAATINAGNETQLRAAARLRQGDLHRWIARLAGELADLLALIEAGIDFADEEEIRLVDAGRVREALARLSGEIHGQLGAAVRIDRLALPPTIVFIGKPNVGKSSLINALSASERSIVSPIPGTTRDMLAANMAGPRGEVRLLDAPGAEAPTDELRRKMMDARAGALLDADLIAEVLDAPGPAPSGDDCGTPRVTIWNKADLFAGPVPGARPWQVVSAKTGRGIAELRAALATRVAQDQTADASRLALNHRHRVLLQEAGRRLHAAGALAGGAAGARQPELLAAELRQALDALGRITGAISPDEVLGRIFSQFCIGK